jgi:hypothetical protein
LLVPSGCSSVPTTSPLSSVMRTRIAVGACASHGTKPSLAETSSAKRSDDGQPFTLV